MRRLTWGAMLGAMVLATAFSTGCGRAVVIVPRPERGYTKMDTLWGRYKNNRVLVTFRFDTLWRRDTVIRLDTLWRAGTRTIVRVDTVLIPAPAPMPMPTTMPTPMPTPILLPAPTTKVDTIKVSRRDTIVITRRDTITITRRDTVRLTVHDTIRIAVHDTIRLTVRDTVFRVDTIHLAGRRQLFVPPGQYPPEGQCRVWIHDLPPGRQADAAPCNALGTIPPGAFILFHGDAWDFDYDWVQESLRGSVPPEIVALQRRRRP